MCWKAPAATSGWIPWRGRTVPAYAILDGWLLASSNLGALQKLVQAAAAGPAGAADTPAWAAPADGPSAVSVWLDLARSGKVARDAIATWSMAQMFLNSGNSQAVREQLNEVKAWIDAFAPLGRGAGGTGPAGRDRPCCPWIWDCPAPAVRSRMPAP